jgi:peptidoglycan/xylan/chitin deacetylase (PgdA/CDA1 family)
MGSDGARAAAAVSVTFDNLGEASEIGAGVWPDDAPSGEHFSVVEMLPLVLELLDEHRIEATFFVEGLNAEIYPDTLKDLARRGHEVALHAWRHENWGDLDPVRERELLDRGTRALRELGIEPAGFRPPGGRLTERTVELLRENDYSYVSPAGEEAGVLGGLAVLPFRWRLIDAYYYLPGFAGLRERGGDPAEAMGPAQLRDALVAALDEHAAGGRGHLAPIFHPFLVSVDREAALGAIADVLGHIRRLEREGRLRCLRMDRAAGWML